MRASVPGLSLALAVLTLVLGHTPVAHADIAPPDGFKSVDYSFSVTGLGVAKDEVLLAFPCGPSNGVPWRGYVKVDEGKAVKVGTRGGDCELRHIAKAAYDAFAPTYKATNAYENPALEAFMKKTLPCQGAPSLLMTVSSTEPRDTIEEKLVVKELSATACRIESLPSSLPAVKAKPAPSASASASAPSSATAPAASGPATLVPSPPAPPRSKTGCSAAPSPVNEPLSVPLVALAVALGVVLARARSQATRRRPRG